MTARTMLWGLLGLMGLGCAASPAYRVEHTSRFRAQHSTQAEWRAVHDTGVALHVTELSNPGRERLKAWTNRVLDDARTSGYSLVKHEPVRAATGQLGHRLRLVKGDARERWVTIYVEGTRVYVLDASGEREAFAAAKQDVDAVSTQFEMRCPRSAADEVSLVKGRWVRDEARDC